MEVSRERAGGAPCGTFLVEVDNEGLPTWWAWGGDGEAEEHDGDGALPDLDHPATIGCLLALVMEAWDHIAIHTDADETVIECYVGSLPWRTLSASTLAEALVAALEAAPDSRV